MITRRTKASVLLAVLVGAVSACDVDDGTEEQRLLVCELAEPECAGTPEGAQAIEVLASLGMEPEEVTLEIWLGEPEAHPGHPLVHADALAVDGEAQHMRPAGSEFCVPFDVDYGWGMFCCAWNEGGGYGCSFL